MHTHFFPEAAFFKPKKKKNCWIKHKYPPPPKKKKKTHTHTIGLHLPQNKIFQENKFIATNLIGEKMEIIPQNSFLFFYNVRNLSKEEPFKLASTQ